MNKRRPQRRPQPKGASARPPQRRPQPKGATAPRRSLESASATPIAFLQQLPRWLAPSVLAGLFVAGAFIRGWIGAVALCLVAVFIGWLASLSWPALSLPGRLLRVMIIALLLAFALWQGSR